MMLHRKLWTDINIIVTERRFSDVFSTDLNTRNSWIISSFEVAVSTAVNTLCLSFRISLESIGDDDDDEGNGAYDSCGLLRQVVDVYLVEAAAEKSIWLIAGVVAFMKDQV